MNPQYLLCVLPILKRAWDKREGMPMERFTRSEVKVYLISNGIFTFERNVISCWPVLFNRVSHTNFWSWKKQQQGDCRHWRSVFLTVKYNASARQPISVSGSFWQSLSISDNMFHTVVLPTSISWNWHKRWLARYCLAKVHWFLSLSGATSAQHLDREMLAYESVPAPVQPVLTKAKSW